MHQEHHILKYEHKPEESFKDYQNTGAHALGKQLVELDLISQRGKHNK